MKNIFFLCIALLFPKICFPQTEANDYPKIGFPAPTVILKDVDHYEKTFFNSEEYKGKWLILDFWHEYCVGCIASMPKVQQMQDKHASDVQFLLVGMIYKSRTVIGNLYEKIRKKFDLSIPVAYDSTVYKRFGITGAPLIVIIDPKGTVRAITYELTADQLEGLINGSDIQFPRAYLTHDSPISTYSLDQSLSSLFNKALKDSTALYTSILMKWNNKLPGNNVLADRNKLEACKLTLKSLYRLAFTGKEVWFYGDSLYYSFYMDPILQIRDSSLFEANDVTGENYFVYSTVLASETSDEPKYSTDIMHNDRLKSAMQRDLKNAFNYDVTIEQREVEFYELIKNGKFNPQVISKRSKPEIDMPYGPNGGISAKGITIKDLLFYLALTPGAPSVWSGITFQDGTNIKEAIDISIQATFYDEWVLALKNAGFDLITNKKKMNCIVIREPKDKNHYAKN